MKKWIFITGGCGYIGSHIAAQIKDTTDYSVMLIDKRAKELSHTVKYCDIYADEDFTSKITQDAIQQYQPETIIHLADTNDFSSSMINPFTTWENNVVNVQRLLMCCERNMIKNVIFASSGSVYAENNIALDENSKLLPHSPYDTTKIVGEMMLKDWYGAHGIRNVSFRIFNVAGAHTKYDLGELNGSPRLLAKIMESATIGKDFTVFGKDWNTPDNTAIQDYIHVMDVAEAIVKSISWLPDNPGSHVVNLGSGQGYSVQTIIDTTEMLLSKELPYRYGDRRDGDVGIRISNNKSLRDFFNWEPKRTLNDMILDGYKWYNSELYKILTQVGIHYKS
jgi:UDP-glucose 4-epimerase